MLKSKQRKTFKTFGNEILSPGNKDRKFSNLTFFPLLLHYGLKGSFLIGISRKSTMSLNA